MERSGPHLIHGSLGPPKPQTRVHTANSISIGSAVFALLPNIDGSVVFARLRQREPHLTHTSLGPPDSISQTASRSTQPFLHSSRQRVPIIIAPSDGESGPRLKHGSFGSPLVTQFLNPNGISIGWAIFAGLTTVTDRHTDRPAYSVCNSWHPSCETFRPNIPKMLLFRNRFRGPSEPDLQLFRPRNDL